MRSLLFVVLEPVLDDEDFIMILSKRLGIVFIHIPKTAGTSISDALRKADRRAIKHLPGMLKTKHLTACDVRRAVTPEKYDRLYSFAVIRDPFERFCSIFFYIKGLPKFAEQMSDVNSIDAFAELFERPESWVLDLHSARPQCDFIMNEKREQIVTSLYRFGNLAPLCDDLQQRLGLLVPLERLNAGDWDRENCHGLYSHRSRKIIERHYAADLSL